MGFYNYFPLVFFDTGAYIASGFKNEVPMDRPIFYGLFIRHVSLAESLWLVIFCQGVLTALMIYFSFKYLSNLKNFLVPFFCYIILITFFTGASVNVSELIPDIFTPVFLLGLGVLLFSSTINRRDLIIISLVLCFSISVHNSHFLIAGIFMALFTAMFGFRKFRPILTFISPQRIILIWSLIVSTYFVSATVNYSLNAGFAVSKTSSIFLMGRLNETDILYEYLGENCSDKNYKICQYKDSLPWDFIWDYANSPLYKTGGWLANTEEYSNLIRDVLTTPKFLVKFLTRSVEASFKQFFLFDVGNTPKLVQDSSPFYAMRTHYPTLVKEYLSAKQNNGLLDYSSINNFQKYLVALSMLGMVVLILSGSVSMERKLFIIYIVICLLINAAVCGSLSGVSDRYQSRIIWLIPLPLFLVLATRINDRILTWLGGSGR